MVTHHDMHEQPAVAALPPFDLPDGEPCESLPQTAWDGDDEPDAAPAIRAGSAPALDEAQAQALIERIVRHDEAALAALYRALCSRVYRIALKTTNNIASAEEVVEDTFWQVWRQAPRYERSRGGVEAWVMVMARSRALDALRIRARHAAASLGDDELADQPAPGEQEPMRIAESNRLAEQLQQALAVLDPLRRQLVSLAYLKGLTQDEIATHTGLPLGTVKSHLRRSLATLRETLQSGALPRSA